MSIHYNTTITHYPGIIQVKYYQEFSPVGGAGTHKDESPESISYRSLSRTRQQIFNYARCNHFDFFVTLTFNPQLVDSFDYSVSSKVMSDWLSTIRRKYPDLKYVGVPELHKSGRYHFHFLMAGIDGMPMVDGGKRTPKGQVIYNLPSYRFGWSTAIKVYEQGAKLSGYLTKYITKDLAKVTKNRKRYWCSRNLTLPYIETTNLELNEVLFKFSGLEVAYKKEMSEKNSCGIIEYKI